MSNHAINTDATEIHKGIVVCLQAYAKQIQELKPDMYIARHELMTQIKEFLQNLTAISPICANKTKNTNLNDVSAVQKLLNDLAQEPQILEDIKQTQIYAKQAVVQQQNQSKQMRTALAEQQDKVDKVHKASIDSLPHDRMRVLGDLIEDLVRVNYLVPLEQQYYPSGFNYRPESSNSYEDLLRSKYGDTIYQPTGPKM